MSNVQLPTELAIVLGSLALVAPSVAALVQGTFVAKRDDRRWANERENERTNYWRSERTRVYAEFVSALSQWRLALHNIYTAVTTGNDVTDRHMERAADANSRAQDAFGELSLLASDAVHLAARNILTTYSNDFDQFIDEQVPPSPFGLYRELEGLIHLLQRELDVYPLVNPSQPSGSTS